LTAFVEKLSYVSDYKIVRQDLDTVLANYVNWLPYNQIGLRHRDNCQDQWKDSCGGLHDPETKLPISSEAEFSNWNDYCPDYTKQIVTELALHEKINLGRVRYMLAMPKTGLSMHFDKEIRYHLVLQTNISAIFGECFRNNAVRSICYHLPANGHWYKVNTRKEHFIYNGGWEPRIHLVVCPAS